EDGLGEPLPKSARMLRSFAICWRRSSRGCCCALEAGRVQPRIVDGARPHAARSAFKRRTEPGGLVLVLDRRLVAAILQQEEAAMDRTRHVALIAMVMLSLGYQGSALAGPKGLSSCKSLTTPGSYVLTGNLSAVGDCLVVAADFVTIDLAGFSVTGNGTG